MPKIGEEQVRNESTNDGDGVFEVLPIGVDEFVSGNVISVNKIGGPCSLVFDVRKNADGFNIDLDHAEFAFLVG